MFTSKTWLTKSNYKRKNNNHLMLHHRKKKLLLFSFAFVSCHYHSFATAWPGQRLVGSMGSRTGGVTSRISVWVMKNVNVKFKFSDSALIASLAEGFKCWQIIATIRMTRSSPHQWENRLNDCDTWRCLFPIAPPPTCLVLTCANASTTMLKSLALYTSRVSQVSF
jgi:hypothetical protein